MPANASINVIGPIPSLTNVASAGKAGTVTVAGKLSLGAYVPDLPG
jgi:hypothetical protein